MERCNGHASAQSIFDRVLDFWVDWQIILLLIITMSLQLFLVLAGFFRKHTSNPALHACVWVAFLSLDACAAYALGLMLASGCDYVYSLYAPILLFHLGAADAINAYAPTDNDLWHRYGFKMALEIMAAAYIVSRSTDCPTFTSSGVLLFVVGAFKYGERIFSLRSGSQTQILASARPVYKYMALDNQSQNPSLLVAGEQEWYESYNKKGEFKWPNATVTFEDVEKCESLLNLMGHGIVEQVCLAYALFKIFRRRLTNLRIHQKNEDYKTVRDRLLSLESGQIRKVIDLELSFIFDGVFSKASAGRLYQGIGVFNRFIHAILLFTAAMELLRIDTKQHLKCAETANIPFAIGLVHLLMIVALVVEFLQLRKIVRSNWLRVWLACSYITEERLAKSEYNLSELGHDHAQYSLATRTHTSMQHQERWRRLHLFNQRAIVCAFRFVGKPKSSHWNFKLEQLSILVDSLNPVRWHYFMQFEIEKLCEAQSCQLEITNLFVEINMENLQDHLVEKVIERYKVIESFSDLCLLRREISKNIDKIPFKVDSGLEDVVLKCHLLTSVFELNLLQSSGCGRICEDMDVIVSIGLSRYCMHLMIRRPKLMPEDPDVTKILYTGIKQKLKALYLRDPYKPKFCAILTEDNAELEDGILQFARDVLRNMSSEDVYKKWRLLAKVWLDILMFIVDAAENAHPHTEQMAKGGELLTHFWVLLRHLGHGQRSSIDSRY